MRFAYEKRRERLSDLLNRLDVRALVGVVTAGHKERLGDKIGFGDRIEGDVTGVCLLLKPCRDFIHLWHHKAAREGADGALPDGAGAEGARRGHGPRALPGGGREHEVQHSLARAERPGGRAVVVDDRDESRNEIAWAAPDAWRNDVGRDPPCGGLPQDPRFDEQNRARLSRVRRAD